MTPVVSPTTTSESVSKRTNVDGVWAVGDVKGWTGAIESANQGGIAAAMIVHGWYGAVA